MKKEDSIMNLNEMYSKTLLNLLCYLDTTKVLLVEPFNVTEVLSVW